MSRIEVSLGFENQWMKYTIIDRLKDKITYLNKHRKEYYKM